jgi:hypothetical protein
MGMGTTIETIFKEAQNLITQTIIDMGMEERKEISALNEEMVFM